MERGNSRLCCCCSVRWFSDTFSHISHTQHHQRRAISQQWRKHDNRTEFHNSIFLTKFTFKICCCLSPHMVKEWMQGRFLCFAVNGELSRKKLSRDVELTEMTHSQGEESLELWKQRSTAATPERRAMFLACKKIMFARSLLDRSTVDLHFAYEGRRTAVEIMETSYKCTRFIIHRAEEVQKALIKMSNIHHAHILELNSRNKYSCLFPFLSPSRWRVRGTMASRSGISSINQSIWAGEHELWHRKKKLITSQVMENLV